MTPAEAALIMVLTSEPMPEEVVSAPQAGASSSIATRDITDGDTTMVSQPPMQEFSEEGCDSQRVYCTGVDLGYGSTRAQQWFSFSSGMVTSFDLTVGSAGTIAFVPAGFQDSEAALRVWLSYNADGVAINDSCHWFTYTENRIQFNDWGGLQACLAPVGDQLFLNFAFCRSPSREADLYCRESGATSTRQQATLIIQTAWR